MTEHYVTLFDKGFLANGIALHASLMRHAGDFHLWILCVDETTRQMLDQLSLPGVTAIPLAEAETEALLEVKGGRSRAEYCWTLTPFTPDLVFTRDPSATRATYIDADVWLTADPTPIFREFEGSRADVLITEHAYSPEFEQSLAYGIYCVQFMPFTRDGSAKIRRWWQERVIEWCFARPEDGKFGDQKYLDDWPVRFDGAVHVLGNPQWTQAPWNATRFPPSSAVTYHFHRLRTQSSSRAVVGLYNLPRAHVRAMYRPYLEDLRAAHTLLAGAGFTPEPQAPVRSVTAGMKDWLAFRIHNLGHPQAPYSLRF